MDNSRKKVINNMSWLLGGRIVNMILSFFVSLATARYLGPDNFGSINYVAAYVSFFSSITSLGLSVIVIKEVSMGQEDDNEVIWTGILMRFITAVLSTISVIALVSITDGDDPLIIQIAVLESIAILASAFDTFMYWFQGKLLGKYTSIAGVISYLGMSLYRIYLLANNADILWFAFATSVDTLLLSFVLMIFYVRKNGFRPKVSLRLGKKIMRQSYHYMISGLIAILYSKIDQIMFLPMQSLALSATTFVGQNLGAGDTPRAQQGVRRALGISLAVTAVLMVPVLVFAPQLTAFFNRKAEVVAYGTLLLRYISPFYLLCCINQIYSGALRGAGNSQVPMVIMLGSFVVFRQIYLYIVSHFITNTLLPLAMGYPAGWLVCSAATLLYYRRAALGRQRLVEDN